MEQCRYSYESIKAAMEVLRTWRDAAGVDQELTLEVLTAAGLIYAPAVGIPAEIGPYGAAESGFSPLNYTMG